MNILFLVYDIHFIGGAERVTINVANDFVKNDHRVSILSLSRQKSSLFFLVDEKIKIEYLKFDFENLFNIPQKVISLFKVSRYLKQIKEPTVVFGIGTFPSLVLAMIPGMDHLSKVGCQHNSYDFARHIWFFLRKIFFHRLSAIVSLTQEDLPKFKRLNRNVFVIPNSISFFPEKEADLKNKIILAIGRMDYYKGYDLLMKVFEKIKITNPDWKLRIIGEGAYRDQILRWSNSPELSDKVEVLGYTDKIAEEYLTASVYLMTSRSEAFPMVLLEAKSCGLPIVSFNCKTGPSEIVKDGEDGYLINGFDTEEMAEKLSYLCSDYDLRRRFGMNAREDVKRFLPGAVAQKWDNLLQDLKQLN